MMSQDVFTRLYSFKNKEKDAKELRRRRSDTIIQLRKQRKDLKVESRRGVFKNFVFEEWAEDSEQENKLSADEIICNLRCGQMSVDSLKEAKKIISQQENSQIYNSNDSLLANKLLEDDMILIFMRSITREEYPLDTIVELIGLLAHLCSGPREQVAKLVKAGIVPNLISMLSSDGFEVIEQSLMALANISSCCVEMRQLVLSTNFLNHILPMIDSEISISPSQMNSIDENIINEGRTRLLRAIAWFLSVVCQHNDVNSFILMETAFGHLKKLVIHHDNQVKCHALRVLSFATERDPNRPENEGSPILRVVRLLTSDASFLSLIIELLSSNNNDVTLASLNIIGNIVSWGESFTQLMIQAGCLHKFDSLINHQNAHVQREVTFTISNITAGNSSQIEAVKGAGLIPPVVELLYFGDYKTQLEATFVFLNISTKGTVNQALHLMNLFDEVPNMNVFDALATMLTMQDPNAIETALKVYKNLITHANNAGMKKLAIKKCESCAAIVYLDSLQSHSNLLISNLAMSINEDLNQDSSLEEEDFVNFNVEGDANSINLNLVV